MNAAIVQPTLTFNSERHEYSVGGLVIPNVTRVLDALNLRDLPPDRPEREMWLFRGSWVDSVISSKLSGTLDTSAPAFQTWSAHWIGYVSAGLNFIRETKAKVIAVQRRLYHPVYRYAGTLDLEAELAHRGPAIVDWKVNSVCHGTHLQIAAYDLAVSQESGARLHRRIAVALHADGTYKATEFQGRQDRQLFLAALALYNDTMNHGGKDGNRNGNG